MYQTRSLPDIVSLIEVLKKPDRGHRTADGENEEKTGCMNERCQRLNDRWMIEKKDDRLMC